jgi:hypothetical protein
MSTAEDLLNLANLEVGKTLTLANVFLRGIFTLFTTVTNLNFLLWRYVFSVSTFKCLFCYFVYSFAFMLVYSIKKPSIVQIVNGRTAVRNVVLYFIKY